MRLNVELNETQTQLLDEMLNETGVTKKKLVVSSLMFLGWALSERAKGNAVVAMPPTSVPYSNTSTFWSELIRPNRTDTPAKP